MSDEVIKYYVSVKFETTNKSYTFSTEINDIYQGSKVVVETQYGLELGEVVSPLRTESSLGKEFEIKPILRKATKEDVAQYEINKKDAKKALKQCQEEADKLNLDMNVIQSEYTLDRSKITFIYVADDRVDFRELLKVLANIFRCRIELRQIGARDKAKIVSGIGTCGRELCCSGHLGDFDMVSINMAKNQLLALNIQKLSGHCGKLMCCLKYEDESYKELRKGLPKLNAQVEYEGVKYRVTSMNVIAKTCKLENKESAIFITLDELMNRGIFKAATKKEPESIEEVKTEIQHIEEVTLEETVKEEVQEKLQKPEKKPHPKRNRDPKEGRNFKHKEKKKDKPVKE